MLRHSSIALALVCLPAILVAQSDPGKRIEELERESLGYIRTLTDWGGLTRYGSDNAELKPDPKRVIFFGDDIISQWGENGTLFFPGKPYLNRGVEKQATPQMLVRFRQDVINLKPAVVVIQGGSNDLAGFAGPATERTVAENLETMTELARLHGIRVVLSSVTPVCDCGGVRHTLRRPPGRIMGLNGWIKEYAERSGVVFLDYDPVLRQGRALKAELTSGGFLPNEKGYAAMAPLAEKAITAALASK